MNPQNALENFFKSLKDLREHQILKNNRDITSQLGEWLVEQLYDGVRSDKGNQPGWDVKTKKGELIQVKSHAKALSTTARWSAIQNFEKSEATHYVIVVFSPNYELKALYEISKEHCKPIIEQSKDNKTLYWNKIETYRKYKSDLPNSLFHILEYFNFQ